MYKKIINPNTGKALSIDKPDGIKVLKKYLEVIDMQIGGEDKKDKRGKSDGGVEKAVKNKGSEIVEEIIDGPKEVANFFGKNINISQKISHFGFSLLILSILLNGVLAKEHSSNMRVGDEIKFLDKIIQFQNIEVIKKQNYQTQ